MCSALGQHQRQRRPRRWRLHVPHLGRRSALSVSRLALSQSFFELCLLCVAWGRGLAHGVLERIARGYRVLGACGAAPASRSHFIFLLWIGGQYQRAPRAQIGRAEPVGHRRGGMQKLRFVTVGCGRRRRRRCSRQYRHPWSQSLTKAMSTMMTASGWSVSGGHRL